jgi:hypothetical protein
MEKIYKKDDRKTEQRNAVKMTKKTTQKYRYKRIVVESEE